MMDNMTYGASTLYNCEYEKYEFITADGAIYIPTVSPLKTD